MTKIVGFDLDDTLIPEVLFLRSGIHYVASYIKHMHPEIPVQRIIGRMETAVANRQNHYSALESILKEFGIDESVDMKEIVGRFRSQVPDKSIYHLSPSMQEILEKLKMEPGVKLVLITDGRSITQRNKIRSAGLDAYFDEDDIYISEETGHDKMSPDSFLHVMEKYAEASEFHYVGDNPKKDFLHPSRLGWHTHQAHPFPLMIHPHGMPR